jgi:hypothetical protein
MAVVLTYGEPWLYRRPTHESWAEAFRRNPQRLPPHHLEQAEAVAFDPAATVVWVTSEGRGAPLLRYQLP